MKKRIIAMLLVLTMAVALAACGSSTANTEKTWKDELGTAGKLRVGMAADYPPYESYDAKGNVVGFDADMAKIIADGLGVELEIVPMEFDTIISAVSAGTVDMGISCFSYNEERAKSVLFSDTYMTSAQACFSSTAYGIDSMEALAGGIVGAGNGTTGYDVAEALKDQYGFTPQVGEIAVMTESLRSGAMQAIITELCVAQSYIDANPGEYQMLADDLSVEEIKAITNLKNTELNAKVNEIIAATMAEDSYNDLIVSWFG
ncbi:MAG: amino acid ABC transporter substrate-binding protein [Oscillospiraceae bacterium]|nr:amino acid ABC transporter substrate-binding protein [Oscillospiraceae bacterium]